ncbi:MAG: secretin N-terminal domain-containing protein [Pyrinomonadaceae bacterium]
MRIKTKTQLCVSLLLTFSLLILPVTALAKKGDKNFKRGMQYENSQQWEKAAQEFTLAVAADPSNMEYQLHFRRAAFNASQSFMQQGRALAEQRDFVGAYNAFRQAYGYDAVNELAVSEMDRMLRLQSVKDGTSRPSNGAATNGDNGEGVAVPASGQVQDQTSSLPARAEQLRVITYNGDLKAFVRSLAEQLQLNVVFDRQSFAQSRTIDINLRDVTTAQALDYIFLQEGLFFQKLSRRTILVADQTRRPQYQQLVLRTFFLSNMKPSDARQLIQQAIPPSVGRPQTIVVPDDATNSLTVRDTAENVRLIGDLLASIDKDRAEVVMDVNIYEVSKSDFMQFGNQIGNVGSGNTFNIGGSPGFSLLTGNGTINGGNNGVNLAPLVGGVPTALAAALVIPSSVLTAFQSKANTKLIASTQVHAFNGEESTARIGQRVPVQTAQTYPFGIQTGQPAQGTNFPTGGFPVINYEPTGLTLKFTPQVFPNLDVQVKMSIESKDVLGASTLTPTFTERTITGTARVQNNRTMMLASVAQNIESRGRKGLPLLGLIPVLGRLFTSPTRDDRQVDIVIAVTPRVLRAPTVTPRDEEMRPSGTLQSPTTGSLEAMIIESDREDQLAAARRLPRNSVVNLPDVEPAPFSPVAGGAGRHQTAVNNTGNTNSAAVAQNPAARTTAQTYSASNTQAAAAQSTEGKTSIEELPAFVPAPKSMVSERSAEQLALVNTGIGGAQNAALTSSPKPIDTSTLVPLKGAPKAQMYLTGGVARLKAGEKRQMAIELMTDMPVGLAVLMLRFDPKVIKVTAINPGTLLPPGHSASTTQSVDPKGVYMFSLSTFNGATPLRGGGSLVLIQIEAIAEGDPAFSFDPQSLRLITPDARDIAVELVPVRGPVK